MLEPALSFPQRLAYVQAFFSQMATQPPFFKCAVPAGCISVAHCMASPLHLVELRRATTVQSVRTDGDLELPSGRMSRCALYDVPDGTFEIASGSRLIKILTVLMIQVRHGRKNEPAR
jgi:hypothetical protein